MLHGKANVTNSPRVVTACKYAGANAAWSCLAPASTKAERFPPQPLPTQIVLTLHKFYKNLRVTLLGMLEVAADPHGNNVVGERACIGEQLRWRGRQRRSLERHKQRRNPLTSQERRPTCRIYWWSPSRSIIRPALSLGDHKLLLHAAH